MPHTVLTVASVATHRDALTELFVEYLTWVFAGVEAHLGVPADQINGMSVAQYVPTVIDKLCGNTPPEGVFYLIQVDGQWAGMGGLRRLQAGAAEFKRIYCRPAWRGMGLGERLLQRLLTDAQAFGYQRVYLDTAPFMAAALRLYQANGFADCAAYEGVEIPAELHSRWRFLVRAL